MKRFTRDSISTFLQVLLVIFLFGYSAVKGNPESKETNLTQATDSKHLNKNYSVYSSKTNTMKKFVYFFSAITLISSVSLLSCNNSAEDGTTENDAKKDTVVIEEKNDAVTIRVATSEEWAAFKADAEAKIEANEKRIAELKVKLKKPGKLLDKVYTERIEALEQRNRDLRLKITAYETTKTDWEKFKEEFNHDMDELGKAIGDIFTDNK